MAQAVCAGLALRDASLVVSGVPGCCARFAVHTVSFAIYLRPDQGRHAPSWQQFLTDGAGRPCRMGRMTLPRRWQERY